MAVHAGGRTVVAPLAVETSQRNRGRPGCASRLRRPEHFGRAVGFRRASGGRLGRTALPGVASSLVVAAALPAVAAALPAAVLFDCDGVLADTEREGHRPTFNEAFRLRGLGCSWDADLYGELLKIGGGKERMTKYFLDHESEEPFRSVTGVAERSALVADLHRVKTDLFTALVESGRLPLRPGIAALVGEAVARGVPVAVCSTSNELAVAAIVRTGLGPAVADRMRVFAGDVVAKKKPDPAVYLLAAATLKVDPARCVVIEDSAIGLRAAVAAGMRCVVTTSSYTRDEDFSTADAVMPDASGLRLDDLACPGLLLKERR